MKQKVNAVFQVWQPHGERIEVAEDRDALGLVEISSVSSEGKRLHGATFTVEQLSTVIEALENYRDFLAKERE